MSGSSSQSRRVFTQGYPISTWTSGHNGAPTLRKDLLAKGEIIAPSSKTTERTRRATTRPASAQSRKRGTPAASSNVDPRFAKTFNRPTSATAASRQNQDANRNQIYATNIRLMEKNEMLRRELNRLQKNREQREDNLNFRGSISSRNSGRRSSLDGPSNSSVKTIEISSMSSSELKEADSKNNNSTSKAHRAAGSGVHAVRACTKVPISGTSLDVEGKEGNSFIDMTRTGENSKSSTPSNRLNEETGHRSSPSPSKRPQSAGIWRQNGAETKKNTLYGKVSVEKPTVTATQTTSGTNTRPSSAHPSTREEYAAKKTSSVASSGSGQRPKSAYSATSSASAKPSGRLEAKPSSSSSSANHAGGASQQQEKERLQKLIASPEWDGIGRPDCYVFGKLLGQGSFGTVRLAHHKITGHKVAVKTYERAKFKDAAQVKRAKQEIALMTELNHIHICRLFEVFETSKRIHLVMEAASGGNLCTYVKSRKRLPEGEAVRIFFHLTLALEYLHANDIVHRDVKLENVLFDSNRVIKLVDFGFSVKAGDRKLKVFCGTPSYMAPEIVRRKEYAGFPVDVWSLGVLLYAMLCGRFPFTAKTYPELYKKIARGVFQIPEQISPSVRDALRRMLCLNASLRITIPQLKEHKVLTEREATFPRVPTPNECTHLISDDPKSDMVPSLVKQLVDFGFPKERLTRSILEKRRDHFTTTYYLLAMKAEKKRLMLAKQREPSAATGTSYASKSNNHSDGVGISETSHGKQPQDSHSVPGEESHTKISFRDEETKFNS